MEIVNIISTLAIVAVVSGAPHQLTPHHNSMPITYYNIRPRHNPQPVAHYNTRHNPRLPANYSPYSRYGRGAIRIGQPVVVPLTHSALTSGQTGGNVVHTTVRYAHNHGHNLVNNPIRPVVTTRHITSPVNIRFNAAVNRHFSPYSVRSQPSSTSTRNSPTPDRNILTRQPNVAPSPRPVLNDMPEPVPPKPIAVPTPKPAPPKPIAVPTPKPVAEPVTIIDYSDPRIPPRRLDNDIDVNFIRPRPREPESTVPRR